MSKKKAPASDSKYTEGEKVFASFITGWLDGVHGNLNHRQDMLRLAERNDPYNEGLRQGRIAFAEVFKRCRDTFCPESQMTLNLIEAGTGEKQA